MRSPSGPVALLFMPATGHLDSSEEAYASLPAGSGCPGDLTDYRATYDDSCVSGVMPVLGSGGLTPRVMP